MTEVAITPVAFVRAIVAAYRRYGKDPGDALRRARIAPEFLSDPRNRVTGSQMQTLFGIAIQELDDEALGWFSRRLPSPLQSLRMRDRSACRRRRYPPRACPRL